jgi:DNA-binding transcriptional ArsR family regulator
MKGIRRRQPSSRKVADGVCEVDCVNPRAVEDARGAAPPESALRGAADALRAVSRAPRLRIVLALEGRELCVCDLAGVLGLSMSSTSQHLRELRNVGAVDYRVQGRLVYYRLADPFFSTVAADVLARTNGVTTAAPGGRRTNRVPA